MRGPRATPPGRYVARARLLSQHIVGSSFTEPEQVVAALGAMQAQDYLGSLWAIGLRLANPVPIGADTGVSDETRVEQAATERRIVRTWPMRGTLHWVAAADVRWMLRLLTGRVMAGAAGRHRQLGLDARTFVRAEKLLGKELSGGVALSRQQAYDVLERGRIATGGQRGIHILGHLARQAMICFGARSARQPTFVLLDEWIGPGRDLTGEEALAELARRYFSGHGPATLHDFVWWSGLRVADARRGIEAAGSTLRGFEVEGVTHWTGVVADERPQAPASVLALLPPFDEFLVGYRDRSAAIAIEHQERLNPGANGMLRATLVRDGRVLGVWQRRLEAARKGRPEGGVHLRLEPFSRLRRVDEAAWRRAALAYGRFLGAERTTSEILPVEERIG